MKKPIPFILFSVALLLFLQNEVAATNKNREVHIKGTVKELASKNEQDFRAFIIVIIDGEDTLNYATDKRGKYEFKVMFDHFYEIQYHKEYYISKKITLDTQEVPNKETKYIYELLVDIELERKTDKVNDDYIQLLLDHPIGRAKFDEKHHGFQWDADYTKRFVKELKVIHDKK